jgi:transcriptional regulator with XRE-family HTH domain
MSSERSTPEAWGQHLTKALRAVRKARGMSGAQVAASMGMDRRNYINFESGKGRLNLARIVAFAQVTDSDAWAILAAVMMGTPRLALVAANNKLLTAFFILLGEFEQELGDALRTLDTADVVSAFRDAFRTLAASAEEKRARLPVQWLQEGVARMGLAAALEPDEDESGR